MFMLSRDADNYHPGRPGLEKASFFNKEKFFFIVFNASLCFLPAGCRDAANCRY